jgi:hypothetical protein
MGLKKVSNRVPNLNEEQVRKLVKKTQVVYKAFRKGTATFFYTDDVKIKYRYVLDDDYFISIDKTVGNMRGEGAGEILIRIIFDHMTVEFIDIPSNTFLQKDMSGWKHPIVGQIEKKFQPFDVRLGVPLTITNITQK